MIRKIENIIPTKKASPASVQVTWKAGNTNWRKPVLIAIGGIIIFLDVTGSLVSLILKLKIIIPMMMAKQVLAIKNTISYLPLQRFQPCLPQWKG